MTYQHSHDEEQDLSLLALEQYMRFVNATPPLTDEEEEQLPRRIEGGKQERAKRFPDRSILDDAQCARDRLVEGLQWMIRHHAYRVIEHCRSMEILDLIQEGNLGLLEAIERYQVSQGVRFRIAASTCIRHAIWRAMAERDHLITLPLKKHQELGRMRHVRQRLRDRLHREPSLLEIVREMGVSEQHLAELLEWENGQYAQSWQALCTDERPEDHMALMPLYQQTIIEMTAWQQELEQAVQQAIAKLPGKRQQEVMRLRYDFGEGAGTLRSCQLVGEMLGATKGCVRELEWQAMRHLRPHLASYVDGSDENGEVA